jgi:hypothetical protein
MSQINRNRRRSTETPVADQPEPASRINRRQSGAWVPGPHTPLPRKTRAEIRKLARKVLEIVTQNGPLMCW